MRMALSSGLGRLLLVGVTSFVLVEACASAAERRPDEAVGGTSGGGEGGQDSGPNVIAPDVPALPQAGSGAEMNPLCGSDGCLPDDDQSCASHVEPAPGGDDLTLAGSGGGSGAADAAGAGGSGGSVGDGGAGAGGVPAVPAYACRVGRASGGPRAECERAGAGRDDAPCFTSSDCAAAFACVAEGTVGRCRPFCCAGEASCNEYPGTFCGARPLLETTAAEQSVPVCVPADACDLSKPPCAPGMTPGADCECDADTACLVVRADGVTTCATPGSGIASDPCPCAYGFVCSVPTGMCRTLCELAESGACDPGRCVASAELPDGWGVCIER